MKNNNFWKDLPRPFSALAPMDGVTDAVFRQIIVETGKPDVLFTEFTNCDGLLSSGKDKVIQRLKFKSNEHFIVAQIWGNDPKTFYESAKICVDLGFDGIDINMGCPVRDITQHGACSALIDNPKLAGEIIQATKDGAGKLPVSVKTRVGRKMEIIDQWIRFLLQQDLPALTIHLRTVAEMSKVPAHWEYMAKIVKLRNEIAPQTLLVGNGDVQNLVDGEEKTQVYRIEGIMYGRAVFSDPWLFNKSIDKTTITVKQRLVLFQQHLDLFRSEYGETTNYAILKKYCKIYMNSFSNAAELREKIMLTKSLTEMEQVTKDMIKSL